MYYLVGVYWPGQGYGGMCKCHNLDEVRSRVEWHKRNGYGKPGGGIIRVVKRTEDEVVEEHFDDGPNATKKAALAARGGVE